MTERYCPGDGRCGNTACSHGAPMTTNKTQCHCGEGDAHYLDCPRNAANVSAPAPSPRQKAIDKLNALPKFNTSLLVAADPDAVTQPSPRQDFGEPWAADRFGHVNFVSGEPVRLEGFRLAAGAPREEDHDYDRRIVAAVNATAGIPTAALEAGAVKKAREMLCRSAGVIAALLDDKPVRNLDEFMSELASTVAALESGR